MCRVGWDGPFLQPTSKVKDNDVQVDDLADDLVHRRVPRADVSAPAGAGHVGNDQHHLREVPANSILISFVSPGQSRTRRFHLFRRTHAAMGRACGEAHLIKKGRRLVGVCRVAPCLVCAVERDSALSPAMTACLHVVGGAPCCVNHEVANNARQKSAVAVGSAVRQTVVRIGSGQLAGVGRTENRKRSCT